MANKYDVTPKGLNGVIYEYYDQATKMFKYERNNALGYATFYVKEDDRFLLVVKLTSKNINNYQKGFSGELVNIFEGGVWKTPYIMRKEDEKIIISMKFRHDSELFDLVMPIDFGKLISDDLLNWKLEG